MVMFGLFNARENHPIPRETFIIVDDTGEYAVDKEYAELGLVQGWLTVSLYYIDVFDVQHYQLAYAPP